MHCLGTYCGTHKCRMDIVNRANLARFFLYMEVYVGRNRSSDCVYFVGFGLFLF